MTRSAGKSRRAGRTGKRRCQSGGCQARPDIFAGFADLADEAARHFAAKSEGVDGLKQISAEMRKRSRK